MLYARKRVLSRSSASMMAPESLRVCMHGPDASEGLMSTHMHVHAWV